MGEKDNTLKILLSHVENTFGSQVKTPKQFESLRESIMQHTGVLLSATTLKRLWGYLDEEVAPRESTLDVLASYAGWKSWNDFVAGEEPDIESGTIAGLKIDVGKDLRKGDVVRLLWNPQRVCDVEYSGNMEFRVIHSENTRLQPDDRFTCPLIISGEPLYLDNLTRENTVLGVYVCGRNSGIKFIRSFPDFI